MSTSTPPTPPWALIPILHASHQVVLYNPTSHALSIRERAVSELKPKSKLQSCPYCERPYNTGDAGARDLDQGAESRVHNYFQLLAVANESSRPPTPFASTPGPEPASAGIATETMAEGYFSAFFKEDCRLGMGANGSVFLCQHVLDGNPLGRFAVKKIAVGQSHDYLHRTLREVRLLETLHHPNIITYHHSWLETCRFSSFGPSVPTLFILMQWAEGGSLDDFIRARLGVASPHTPHGDGTADDEHRSRSSRIRAFRAAQARPEETRALRLDKHKAECGRAVHLLSPAEVKDVFNDVVCGLGFLHAKSILHLDLKPGNVLLTWDEGKLIPRAMLSDFGTYQDMVRPSRARTGDTGTLEYTAPETLSSSSQLSSKADMWSLGMILHILLFFRLPYEHVENSDIMQLEEEVRNYRGFKPTAEVTASCKRRGFPRAAVILLGELLAVLPRTRPSCEQILAVLKEGKLDPLQRDHTIDEDRVSLVTVARPRRDSTPAASPLATVAQIDSSEPIAIARASDASTDASTSAPASIHEKAPLSLPAPPTPPARLVPRLVGVRVLKSAIVVVKVLSLTNVCGSVLPQPTVLCVVLILAVLDTWTDGVTVSVFLGVVHLWIITLGKDRCCVY